MCNNLDIPQNSSFHHFISFNSTNHIQTDVRWCISDGITMIMQIICNNKNKKKNVLGTSVERHYFHK